MLKRLLMSAAVVSIPAAGAVPTPKGTATDQVHFVSIPEIMVPIVDGDAVDGLLKVDIVLAATDESAAASLTLRRPNLRAASVTAVLEFSRLYASGLNPVDAAQLADSLSAALRQDNPEIARVLIVKVAAAVS